MGEYELIAREGVGTAVVLIVFGLVVTLASYIKGLRVHKQRSHGKNNDFYRRIK